MIEITTIEAARLFTTSHKLSYWKVPVKAKQTKTLIGSFNTIIQSTKETLDAMAKAYAVTEIKGTLNYNTDELGKEAKETFNKLHAEHIDTKHEIKVAMNFLSEKEYELMIEGSDANFSDDTLLTKYFVKETE